MCELRKTSAVWLTALAAFSLFSTARSQTLVPPGPTSGEWNMAGSPYIVVDNITVPSGQTLTIDPGVTVLIGSNLTLTANGSLIQAVGTPSQRITISADSSAFNYNTISLINPPGTNRFKYCDFANAQTAISMSVIAPKSINQFVFDEIMNCSFSNCVSQAIYGSAQGTAGGQIVGPGPYLSWSESATLSPMIKNCIFSGTSNGCVLNIYGQHSQVPNYWNQTGYGFANPTIAGNVFQTLSGTAFLMEVGTYAGGGSPVFVNNTMVDCRAGVNATDPWDALSQNNIFVGATNAVMVSGSLSRGISYNEFYSNAINFTALPAPYGQIIWSNRNGTPTDALFNIYQDPLFVSANDFHLAANSACVNAGSPNPAYANMCFPPSIATNFPDLGAYGGPDACNWLTVVPKLPVQLSITEATNQLKLSWHAIPRSSYQVQYLGTNLNATSGTNKWLANSTVTPANSTFTMVAPYGATNREAFYRVQSMGRTPGN